MKAFLLLLIWVKLLWCWLLVKINQCAFIEHMMILVRFCRLNSPCLSLSLKTWVSIRVCSQSCWLGRISIGFWTAFLQAAGCVFSKLSRGKELSTIPKYLKLLCYQSNYFESSSSCCFYLSNCQMQTHSIQKSKSSLTSEIIRHLTRFLRQPQRFNRQPCIDFYACVWQEICTLVNRSYFDCAFSEATWATLIFYWWNGNSNQPF